MKITKVNYYYTRTIQMRQFEPVVVSLSMEAQIDVGESAEVVLNKVKHQVKVEVEEEIRSLKRERIQSWEDEMEKSE